MQDSPTDQTQDNRLIGQCATKFAPQLKVQTIIAEALVHLDDKDTEVCDGTFQRWTDDVHAYLVFTVTQSATAVCLNLY